MISIPVVSYGAGGIFNLALGLLLIFGWKGRGLLFVLAIFYSAGWCFLLALSESQFSLPFFVLFWLEVLRYGLWTLFLFNVASGGKPRATNYSRFLLLCAVGAYGFALLSGVGVYFEAGLRPGYLPVLPVMGLLVLILFGLILVEQFYRNIPVGQRWAVKFLCLGIAGLLAYDFYLYANALLFRQFDWVAWSARGAVNALVVPLIAVSVARNPQWSLSIFVSRHVVFYSTSMISAGIYLLVMALGGYYIRIYGGNWGTFLQMVFLFGAGLLLFIIMMSAQLRSRLRLFLSEHFFSNKYDYRREWLRLINTLSDTLGELNLHQRTIAAVCGIVEARGGALWVLQGGLHYAPVATWNMDEVDAFIEDGREIFLTQLKTQQNIIDLTSSEGRHVLADLPGWVRQHKHAWLVIPLVHDQQVFGIMLLLRKDYSPKITWEDVDLLKTVGMQVASYLVQHETGRALVEARQFEAYNQLSIFIMHDLKNIVGQLSLIAQNAAKHKHNPAFIEDAIETIQNSVKYMGRLMEQLKTGRVQGNVQNVRMLEVVEEAVRRCSAKMPVPKLVGFDDELSLPLEGARFTMMLSHLISNAQDATPSDGMVEIQFYSERGYVFLKVVDTGCGMDRKFIAERLFSPFDSTKGARGMGVGAYEVREFVRSMGGDVIVKSELGKGTVFVLLIPLHSIDSQMATLSEK